jgi:hypothetical protein
MQLHQPKKLSLGILVCAPFLLLAGCANKEKDEMMMTTRSSAEKAQATAQQALETANTARTEAQQAQRTADQALSAAQAANEKADRMFQRGLRK